MNSKSLAFFWSIHSESGYFEAFEQMLAREDVLSHLGERTELYDSLKTCIIVFRWEGWEKKYKKIKKKPCIIGNCIKSAISSPYICSLKIWAKCSSHAYNPDLRCTGRRIASSRPVWSTQFQACQNYIQDFVSTNTLILSVWGMWWVEILPSKVLI